MKETLRRALRTFIQTAVGVFCTSCAPALTGVTDWNITKSVLMTLAASSIAAGIAAAMNLPKQY